MVYVNTFDFIAYNTIEMFSTFELKKTSNSAMNADDRKKLWFTLNFGFSGLYDTNV